MISVFNNWIDNILFFSLFIIEIEDEKKTIKK